MIRITDKDKSINLRNRFFVYEAPRHSVDPGTIPDLYRSGAFKPPVKKSMPELDGKNEHWLVFRVRNESSDDRKILSMKWYRFTKINAYMPDCSNKARIPQFNNHFPSFELRLPWGAECTVFVEVGHALYTIEPPNLLSHLQHESDSQAENVVFGLFAGLLMTLALYHIIIFFSLREWIYLFYSSVLIVLLIQNASFYGFLYQLGIIIHTDIFRLVFHGSWMMGYSSISLFIVGLVQPGRHFPRASRWVFRGLLSSLVLAAVILVLDLDESRIIQILPPMYLLISLTTVSVLVLLIAGAMRGDKIYLIMGIAFGIYLFSIWIFSVSELLLLPHTFITRYAEIIGSSIQALLFSFALSYRINALRLDRISAQKEALASKDIALQSLKQAARIKDEFLARTSHELRTPLQGMIALSEYLLDLKGNYSDEERSRSLDMIRLSGKRLSVLVNDLLDYAKMKEGGLALQKKEILLQRVVDSVISMHRVLLRKNTVRLISEIPEGLCVKADEDRLSQVLHNLLGNAVRFTDRGEILVRAKESGEGITVSVDDTGTGIPPEMREIVFEEFRQLGSGERGGTGLGLAVTKQLVDLHGGRIWIEQGKSGTGTCVLFTLDSVPCVPACKIASRLAISQPEASVTFPQISASVAGPVSMENLSSRSVQGIIDESTAQGDKRLILLVDDDPMVIESISRLLILEGYSVLTAFSASEARSILENKNIDLAIVDVMMPGESGYDLCRDIRMKHQAAELPVLLLSALNRTEDLIAGVNAGANDYLAKPATREELSMRLRGLLAMRDNHLSRNREKEAMQEALQKERHRIYGDLHDNIAAHLTDLILFVKTARSGDSGPIDDLWIRHIERLAQNSIFLLRDRLQYIEDLSHIEEDFPGTMELILYSRYTTAGRKIQWNAHGTDNFDIPESAEFRQDFLAMIMELANNDLKYGKGASQWEMCRENRRLTLRMEADTGYDFSQNRIGRGTALIQERSSRMGGDMRMEIRDGRFQFEFSGHV